MTQPDATVRSQRADVTAERVDLTAAGWQAALLQASDRRSLQLRQACPNGARDSRPSWYVDYGASIGPGASPVSPVDAGWAVSLIADEPPAERGAGVGVEVRLLGPIEVVSAAGETVSPGTRKQRGLLTILTLARGQIVSADRLVDELWGDEPPAQALASLYPYISNLRRLLERRRDAAPAVLVTVPPGYVLRLPADAVDAVRFELAATRVSSSLAAGDVVDARVRAEQALAMWRGPALGEFASEPFAALDAMRLEELRLTMLEDLFEARLGQSDGRLVADVERFTGEHTLRERGWELLMRVLYASGRQSDALRAYQQARTHLLEELGVEPGPPLRELEQSILRHDDDLVIFRVEAPAAPAVLDESRGSAAPPAPAPAGLAGGRLVGRRVEMEICRGVLDDVGARALIVEGEPGIGKTRLVEELAALAEQRGMLVGWGRAFEGASAPAFWPWLPPLRTLAGLVPDDFTIAAELTALLSPSPSAGGVPGAAGNTDPGRFALFDAIAGLLERVAEQRQIVIVLDDLQWADVASLELVTALATRLTKGGVVLVATTRELDVGRNDSFTAALAALTRMRGGRRIRLRGLDHDEAAKLLAAVTGAEIEPATAAAVYGRAEGNPFFTTELARLLSATSVGALVDDIPAGVRDVIRRRLEPLPAPTLELMQVASVIGRDVELELLARASGQEMLDCLESLEPAVLGRIVIHIDDRPGTYRFVHALVREVLVDDLAPLQLAISHLRIADAIGDGDDNAEIAAEHLWAAAPLGVGRRAAESLERAAHVAVSRSAHERAQSSLERAVELYRSAGDVERELHALALLASVVGAQRGFAALNDSPIIARARQLGVDAPDNVDHLTLLWAEWMGRETACQFQLAEEGGTHLLALAEATHHPLARALGNFTTGSSCWHNGRLPEAVVHYEAARAAWVEAERDLQQSVVNLSQLYLIHPIVPYIRELMGDLPDPPGVFDEIRRMVPGDRQWALIVSYVAAVGALAVGDFDRAERETRLGIAADPEGTAGFWSSGVRACLGAALCASGAVEEGSPLFDAAWQAYTGEGNHVSGSMLLANVAMGFAGAGRLGEAAAMLAGARHEIETYGERYAQPLVVLAEAVLAAAHAAESDVVRQLLSQAHAIAEDQGAGAIAARIRRTAVTLGMQSVAVPGWD